MRIVFSCDMSFMAVYRLSYEPACPPPEHADPDGLLAIGGDLSSLRILEAYRRGIFPWYSDGQPICWWSPDPRFTLFPHALHVSQRLKRVIRSQCYTVQFDTAFDAVIKHCATACRVNQIGTWITPAMRDAYSTLHGQGMAHSVESWQDGELAGGLYGVALGGTFFGESMFTHKANASKVAFVALVRQLHAWGFDLIDCQVASMHLARFGARSIPRSQFLAYLRSSVNRPHCWGRTQRADESSL